VGFYTAFRLDCIVKPGFSAAIAHRMGPPHTWEATAAAFPGLSLPPEFMADPLRDFIPNGAAGHMPDGWHAEIPGEEVFLDKEGNVPSDSKRFFDPATRRWTFACTVQNHGDVIGKFIRGVVPLIAERVDLCQSETEDLIRTTYHSGPSGNAETVSHWFFRNEMWEAGSDQEVKRKMPFDEIVDEVVVEIITGIVRRNMPMFHAFVGQVCGHGIRLGDCDVCRVDARLLDQFMTAWFAGSLPHSPAHSATDDSSPGA
jgi:hypothetical protein